MSLRTVTDKVGTTRKGIWKLLLSIVFLVAGTMMPVYGEQYVKQDILRLQQVLEHDSTDVEALKEASILYLRSSNFDQAILVGERLLKIGYDLEDYGNAVLYGHIALGQAYIMKGDTIARSHLGQARTIGESSRNYEALGRVYNGLGLYASNIQEDYYTALNYFFKGLEAVEISGNKSMKGILLGNISGIYYLKKDTVGLSYSLEAYELGHEEYSPHLIYIGAISSAYMYYLKHDYADALKFVQEAEFLMKQNGFMDQGSVYSLYGLILYAQGNSEEAIQMFRQGLDEDSHNQTSSEVYVLYGYAMALKDQGKIEDAIEQLERAWLLSVDNNNRVYRSDILTELAVCNEALHRYEESLSWLRKLQHETASRYNTEKEQVVNDLRIKYDIERQENELRKHKLALLQKTKNEQILFVGIVGVGLLVTLLTYLYYRKNKLYRTIVLRNQAAVRREEYLERQLLEWKQRAEKELVDREGDLVKSWQKDESIAEPKVEVVVTEAASDAQEGKYASSSLSEEKRRELFLRLENCMSETKIYKDKFLTKERVAELLETNRTYLSQAINEQTGQTFTQYINKYRIDEAVRILSNASSTQTLKSVAAEVGFSSMTTFYKVFQQLVGIPPKQYQETVRTLHANREK